MGLIDGFKDAFDDVRTLHLQVTEKQLAYLYDEIPANTQTFGLKLDVPDRVLGTWMDVFYRRNSFHYSYILSNEDVLRTIRDCRNDADSSFGYLLRIPVDYADIVKMHYNNRVRVESVLKLEMKFRPLRACWRVRGEPKAWKEGAVVEVTSKRSAATTSKELISSEVTSKSSTPSAATSKPSTPSTATSKDSAPSATTSKQSTRRPPPPPPSSATLSATSSAQTALTASALQSMATLRPEDSVLNVGRWVRATPGGSSTSR